MKFTSYRVLYTDDLGITRVFEPPKPNMIPYVDVGYHGGMYWAEPNATPADFEKEGHLTRLVYLGWDQCDPNRKIREAMEKPHDGEMNGVKFWILI